jgi:hypothetical protein
VDYFQSISQPNLVPTSTTTEAPEEQGVEEEVPNQYFFDDSDESDNEDNDE